MAAATLIALTIAIGFLGFAIFWFFRLRKKSPSKNSVLLIGPSGSGKTVLLLHLCGISDVVSTVSSMKPQTQTLKGRNGAFPVVDFPGHPRLRPQLVSEYLNQAKKIVFVIDSTNSAKIREAAEILYDIFTDPIFDKKGPAVLIACNKCDVTGSRPPPRIKLSLQDEVDKIRKTRQSIAESNEIGSRIVLGRDGHPFSIDRDSPVEVQFVAVSAQKGTGVDQISSFMDLV